MSEEFQKTMTTKGKADYNVAKKDPKIVREKPRSYLNVNDLEIPEQVADAFARVGFALRFVRFIRPGTTSEIDYANLGKRIQQGYTFVSIKEAPELALSSFKRDIDIVGFEGGDFKDVIVKGDLALMKVPLENVHERNREVAGKTHQAMKAVNDQARGAQLLDASKSESRLYNRGSKEARNVSFMDD